MRFFYWKSTRSTFVRVLFTCGSLVNLVTRLKKPELSFFVVILGSTVFHGNQMRSFIEIKYSLNSGLLRTMFILLL